MRNKEILFESQGNLGYIKTILLEGVIGAEPTTGINTKLAGQNNLIRVHLGENKSYILGFIESEYKRNELLNIINNGEKNRIHLAYVDWFCPKLVDNRTAENMMDANWALKDQLGFIIGYLKNKYIDWKNTDAFRNIVDYEMFMQHKIDESWARLWASTLTIPNLCVQLGINRYQFYSILIRRHNEKISVSINK